MADGTPRACWMCRPAGTAVSFGCATPRMELLAKHPTSATILRPFDVIVERRALLFAEGVCVLHSVRSKKEGPT